MEVCSQAALRPADVVERFIEAEVRYFASEGVDVPPFEEMLDPEFVLIEPDSLPYGGEWRGSDGFKRFLKAMTVAWSSMGPKDRPQLIAQGDTVVVLATLDAKARATQELVRSPVSQIVRVRDGRLVEARMFYWDTVAINRALGHKPT